ncbi:putative amino acid transporter [Penaeus vannamei]|uniref:Putative amino acid transporter n=1 Tax=Penaeus vannamei TaxID=6689 RepID=A0A3R7MFF5_PENVA|nr:putative amino acid transporter [Penaeus vannamei]
MWSLAYAELGTLVSESGGEHAYYMQAFAPNEKRKTWWGQIPAFLFAWVSVFLLKPSSLAIICLTCSEYFVRIFAASTDCLPPQEAVKIIACCVIILITFINSYSVTLATKVQNIFTAAKLLAILIIVVGGSVRLIQGNTQYLATGFQGSTSSFGDIATAFYSGLWAQRTKHKRERERNRFPDSTRTERDTPIWRPCLRQHNLGSASADIASKLPISSACLSHKPKDINRTLRY